MEREASKDPVSFDPQEVVACIHQDEEKAHKLLAKAAAYRELLRVRGVQIDPPPVPVIHSGGSAVHQSRRFARSTVIAAAIDVLREKGEATHANDIMAALSAGGLQVGGKKPMATLTTSLRRHKQIEKVQGMRNYWRFKPEA